MMTIFQLYSSFLLGLLSFLCLFVVLFCFVFFPIIHFILHGYHDLDYLLVNFFFFLSSDLNKNDLLSS